MFLSSADTMTPQGSNGAPRVTSSPARALMRERSNNRAELFSLSHSSSQRLLTLSWYVCWMSMCSYSAATVVILTSDLSPFHRAHFLMDGFLWSPAERERGQGSVQLQYITSRVDAAKHCVPFSLKSYYYSSNLIYNELFCFLIKVRLKSSNKMNLTLMRMFTYLYCKTRQK